MDAPEAERRYKNCRTSYGSYLKKRKSVPSRSGRNAVPTPAEFANLERLKNHINHRAETVTNIAAVPSNRDEECGDVVLDDANVDEQEHPSELVVEEGRKQRQRESHEYHKYFTFCWRELSRKSQQ